MKKRNPIRASQKYLFEVFAVFIGITASFWVEEYRESRREKQKTINVLRLIKEDLIKDSLAIQEKIKFERNNVGSIRKILLGHFHFEDQDSASKAFLPLVLMHNSLNNRSGFTLLNNMGSEATEYLSILAWNRITIYYSSSLNLLEGQMATNREKQLEISSILEGIDMDLAAPELTGKVPAGHYMLFEREFRRITSSPPWRGRVMAIFSLRSRLASQLENVRVENAELLRVVRTELQLLEG